MKIDNINESCPLVMITVPTNVLSPTASSNNDNKHKNRVRSERPLVSLYILFMPLVLPSYSSPSFPSYRFSLPLITEERDGTEGNQANLI